MHLFQIEVLGQTLQLTREEVIVYERIRAHLVEAGPAPARELWVKWLGESSNDPMRSRRLRVGDVLNLSMDTAQHHAEMQARVRDNRQRLNNCRLHDFDTSTIDWDTMNLPQRFSCKRCLGSMEAIAATEYARGFAAGGGDPTKVLDCFTR